MKFKANTPNVAPMTLRQETQMKYNRSRANLLLVLLFTVINLFTVTFGDSYFLFSATIPMLFPLGCAGIAADPEFMAEMGLAAEDATTLMIVGLVIGIVLVIPYLLCWIFSKKRVGWMVAALVFFALDCLFLLMTFDVSSIPDILIHAWVMFYLITGVKHGFALKKLPEDEPLPEFGEILTEGETPAAEDNAPAFDESLFSITEEKTEDAASSTSSEE
jgi:hypothetical protein